MVALEGAWLNSLEIAPIDRPLPIDAAVHAGRSQSVERRHHLSLARLAEATRNSPQRWNQRLSLLVIDYLLSEARARKWKPQTLLREAYNLHGAFSRLPLMSDWPYPVHLGFDPFWRSATRGWEQAANVAQPVGQSAVSLEDVEEALETEEDPTVRVALILMWSTCCRVGDALSLWPKEITMEPTCDDKGYFQVSVLFCRGKGAKLKAPYTVHTSLPLSWATELTQFLQARACQDSSSALFPKSVPVRGNPAKSQSIMARLLSAIRVRNTELNLRAMRRGSLQTMAKILSEQGKSQVDALKLLMSYSGHSNENTLKRYLDWGRCFHTGRVEGAGAVAQGLVPRH